MTNDVSPPEDTFGRLYGSSRPEADQRAGVTGGAVPVAVYGLGKMGLPLAAALADVSGNVVGVDVDPDVVEGVNAGECHLRREPGVPELVSTVVERGRLTATTDPVAAAGAASVHVVVVPTLLDERDRPDLSMLDAVVESVAEGLSSGDLVCVESTVPPRTCADRVRPRLVERSGLSPDRFGVAFCPERTASGRALADIRGSYPKVVGGVDEESGRAAAVLYDELTSNDVRIVEDATTAETVKVYEGVYRDVDIAIANQLALYAEELGVDVDEVRATANEIPYCNLLDPGPGVGGHCIPVYPHFLLSTLETDGRLLRAARNVNDEMPAAVVARLDRELSARDVPIEGASVLLLGTAYRAGVPEIRFSPALSVASDLRARGVDVRAADPIVDDWEAVDATRVPMVDLPDERPDAVVLLTAHEEFRRVGPDDFGGALVLDARGVLDADDPDVVTFGAP